MGKGYERHVDRLGEMLEEPPEAGPLFETVTTMADDRVTGGGVVYAFGGPPRTVAEEVFRRAALMSAIASQADEALLAFTVRPPVIARVNVPVGDGRHAGPTERHRARLQVFGA